MKRGSIIALIFAALFFVAGIAMIAVGGTNLMNNGNWSQDWEQNMDILLHATYVESDPQGSFHAVAVETAMTNVRFVPSTDGKCHASVPETYFTKWDISIENGTLIVKEKQTIPLLGGILPLFSSHTEAVITVPATVKSINVDGAGSDVTIPTGFDLDLVDLDVASGNLMLESNCANVRFDAASGDLNIRGATVGSVTSNTASGNVVLTNVTGTSVHADTASGDITLSDVVLSGQFYADTASGDVTLTRSDAASLDIETISGDVKLNLLTGKLFQIDTTSGAIKAPAPTGTQPCKIDTTSGDVTVTVTGG